jgi:succinyl-diaminopimelate desuccinylase
MQEYLSKDDKKEIIEILSNLISIPSVKSEAIPVAPFGQATADALDFMLSLGNSMGFSTKNLDNKVGYIEFGDQGPLVAVLCHLDVVPAKEGWSFDPFKLRRENGMLIGRGVIDDKGPAVCTLIAMKKMMESGYKPNTRIRLILGLDEESGCLCMDRYKETEEMPICGFTPDASFPPIFAEKGILHIRVSGPSNCAIFMSAGERANMVPASCNVSISGLNDSFTVNGLPAHASTPESGINAISLALQELSADQIKRSPLLTFYEKYIDTNGSKLLPGVIQDQSGSLTLNAGIINIDSNVEELILDIRYPVTANGDEIFQKIYEKADLNALHAEIMSHTAPLHKDPGDPLIRTLIQVYDQYVCTANAISGNKMHSYSRQETVPIAIGGGTYARSISGLVAFGPAFPWDEDQAHSVDEAINEDIFYLLVSIYEDALKKISQSISE